LPPIRSGRGAGRVQQKKQAQDSLQAFQARAATKRELFKKNASAAGQALKDLAKTPPV
jgi:hypothetical protein